MTDAAAYSALLAALSVLCWRPGPGWRAARRVRAVGPGGGTQKEHAAPGPAPARWARVAVVVAGGCSGFVLAGTGGCLAGVAAGGVLQHRLAAVGAREERRRRARLRADLPWAADLLAACLAAGAPPADAADAVASAVGGPVGDAFRRAVALLRLGGDPPSCWLGLAADPELAAIGRALARSAESGTPPAPVISAEAALCRAEGRLAAQAALARVGVLAAAPLGLCFLPAFLLIGIVPVVVGLGADVLA